MNPYSRSSDIQVVVEKWANLISILLLVYLLHVLAHHRVQLARFEAVLTSALVEHVRLELITRNLRFQQRHVSSSCWFTSQAVCFSWASPSPCYIHLKREWRGLFPHCGTGRRHWGAKHKNQVIQKHNTTRGDTKCRRRLCSRNITTFSLNILKIYVYFLLGLK